MKSVMTLAAQLLTGSAILGACLAAQATTYVYVSNADDGVISSYTLDRNAGKLLPLATTPAGKSVMPMAVSPDHQHLYASIRSEPYRVLTYQIDAKSGQLTQQGSAALPASMANIDTDQKGHYLFSAAYVGDIVSVSPINAEGLVQEAQQVVETGQHAHAIHASPDNQYAFASNLGDDQVAQFRFDAHTGQLTPNDPSVVKTPDLTGPRHFIFTPNGHYVYVLGEYSGAITIYAYDADSGTLTRQSTVQGVPDSQQLAPGLPGDRIPKGDDTPRIWAADIQITPDGRHLYTSERTRSTISTFDVNPETGALTYLRSTDVQTQPRGFQIDESGQYMVVSGQRDDEIGLYRIHPEEGQLELIDTAPTGQNANWVEIVSFD